MIALTIPDRHPGLCSAVGAPGRGYSTGYGRCRRPRPDTQSPELVHQVLLALALRDESVSDAEAVELADRALESVKRDPLLAPAAALEAAKTDS